MEKIPTASHSDSMMNMMGDPSINRREFLKLAIAGGVGITAASTLWSQSLAATTPVRGGHFVQALEGSGATSSLDPTTFTTRYESSCGFAFGQRLLGTSPVDGKYIPELAISIDTPDGGQSWVIKLRQGVTFHNGKTMTPSDVVYSLNRHYRENSSSGASGILAEMQSIKASGPDEVTIRLKFPNADLPYFLTDYHLLIQPEGSTDDGIGTAAYKVVENQPGEGATLERYRDYWNSDEGWFDSLGFLAINDPATRTDALLTGKAHVISRVDLKSTDLLDKDPNFVLENTSGRGHCVFLMHCNTAPFDNIDLRLALKHAINREELVEKVLRGYGSVGNDFPINDSYPYYSDDIPQRNYDPEKAAFHYKKSGHSGNILLQVSNVAFSGADDAAVLFQEHAKSAGITLDIENIPSDGYWENIWNVQPFCASYWRGRPTQDQMYSVAYKSDAAWNETRFFNEKFDTLLLQARVEIDSGKRKALYREMALIQRDEGGLILPMFNDFIDARSSKVQGYIRDGLAAVSNGLTPVRCWFEA